MNWQGRLDPKHIAFLENSIQDIFGSLSVEKSLQLWLEHCCFCQITWLSPQPMVAAANSVCLLVLKQKVRQGWVGVGEASFFLVERGREDWQLTRSQDKQRRKSAVCLDDVSGLVYQLPRVPCTNQVTSHLLPMPLPCQMVPTQNNPSTFMFPDNIK